MREIRVQTENLDQVRSRLPHLAEDLKNRGFAAIVSLFSERASTVAYMKPSGILVYVLGSRRLFERFMRLQMPCEICGGLPCMEGCQP